MIDKMKKTAGVALTLAMAVSVAGAVPMGDVQAAQKKPVLAKKSGTLLVGTSTTVKIKNVTKKKVKKLTVTSSKKAVAGAVAAGTGKKTAIKIMAKKVGKATVTAKVTLKNKKKYKLSYKVTAVNEITKKVPVFRKTATKEKAALKFYAGTPNIAYMDIDSYYKLFFPNRKIDISQSTTDKNVYTLTSPTGTATVDVAKETFFSDDYMAFTNLSENGEAVVLDGAPYVQFDRTETLEEGSPVSFDFGHYDIDLKADGKRVYFPIATLSDLYSDVASRFTIYNGKKLYVEDNLNQEPAEERDEKDYQDAFLDNILNRKKQPDLAAFTYRELMFVLDYLYGNPRSSTPLYSLLKEKKSMDIALDELEIDGEPFGKTTKKLITSTDPGEYTLGMIIFSMLMNDGGHTSLWSYYPDESDDARENAIYKAFDGALRKNKALMEYYYNYYFNSVDQNTLTEARKSLRNQKLDLDPSIADKETDKSKYVEKGDTAVCVLDSFGSGTSDSFRLMEEYLKQPVESRTLPDIPDGLDVPIVQFLDALEKASANPKIKNFVLDISNNGGGSSDEVMTIISLMADDSFAFLHEKNTLTGSREKLHYRVDRNFDGVIDEKDASVNYKERFRFAVVTSVDSFSCSNLFPDLAKQAGIPIIGEKSGGGACTVLSFALANGISCRMSSGRAMLMDATGKENIDGGVPVDIDLMPKNADGSVKKISVEYTDPIMGDKTTVEIPDYSALYDVDRLSAEINAWYK